MKEAVVYWPTTAIAILVAFLTVAIGTAHRFSGLEIHMQ
jgi:hypothetical protein